MERQQRVSVCSRESEGVGGRGQGGGRKILTGHFLLLVLLLSFFFYLQGETPARPPANLLSDPPSLEASPPPELEDPQMSRPREDLGLTDF